MLGDKHPIEIVGWGPLREWTRLPLERCEHTFRVWAGNFSASGSNNLSPFYRPTESIGERHHFPENAGCELVSCG